MSSRRCAYSNMQEPPAATRESAGWRQTIDKLEDRAESAQAAPMYQQGLHMATATTTGSTSKPK